MARINQKEWKRYIVRLRKINDKAVEEFDSWVIKNLGYRNIERQVLIDKAYAIATKYGESSAALSAEMYDTVALLQGVSVPAAVPAETATYSEVAKTVNGIIKNSGNENVLAQGIGRLVKMAGTDTILSNAYRDSKIKESHYRRSERHTGAEVAWIPSGDTCPYCIMLASAGWRKETNWGAAHHSEHIHANCDCTYMVRFNHDLDVEGYDPEVYKEMYYAGEDVPYENENNSHTSHDTKQNQRLNGMRRKAYADKKREVRNMSEEAQREILNSSAAEEIKVN